MKSKRFTFKSDKYKKTRGGYSRLLKVACAICNSYLLHYQKDGPGPLKRMYVDRIFESKVSINRKVLVCTHCKEVIGTYYLYPKEKRPAFRLYQNAVVKKIQKSL